jgi:hypothetical protein
MKFISETRLTLEELQNFIEEECNKLDQQFLQNLCDSMPKRLQECIEKNRGITH